jgi:predicted CXXCH cytochrome family protein
MKKLLFLGIGSALMFTMGGVGPASADNGPHVSGALGLGANQAVTADRCAGCHRIHTAKSNDGMLLRTTTQEELCFTCHGPEASGAGTNVVDGVGYPSRDRGANAGALRGGGFKNALIDSSGATKDMVYKLDTAGNPTTSLTRENQKIPALAISKPTTSNHSLGSPGTAWGNGAIGSGVGASITLECGSCHDPHGNGNYRILKPIPTDSGYVPFVKTAATATVPAVMTPATGIAIPDAGAKVYTTTNYWLAGDRNVPVVAGGALPAAGKADGFIANVADWCTTCHTRYYAPNSSSRKPPSTGDPIYTYKHTSNEGSKEAGNKNCVTCHVAHGSNASANGAESSRMKQPDGTSADLPISAEHPLGAAGSRLLRVDNRGICLMCHNV